MSVTDRKNWKQVGSEKYQCCSPIAWEIGRKGSGWILTVPTDFVFDSSVPKFAQWIVSPHHEPWLLAAAIHDYLLEQGFDKAFAAGEWLRAARAVAKRDDKKWLVLPAYYGVVLWTVR